MRSSVYSGAVAAVFLLSVGHAATAQNVYVWNGTSTSWGKTTTAWTGPSLYPGLSARGNGGGAATDIAEYLAAGNLSGPTQTISFDSTSNGVGATLTLGALVYAPATNASNSFALGPASGSATAGTLSFTGAALYGASNVILVNESAGSAIMTVNGTAAATTGTLSLGLAAGVNTIVAGAGTATGYGDSIVLNCAVNGSAAPGGSSITFLGGGSAAADGGTLTFGSTTPSSPTVTGVTVGAADGSNAGRLSFTTPNGMQAGGANVVVNANSQMLLSSSGATFGTAGQTVTLNGAGTRTDAGALLYNPGGTGKTISLAAGVVLASDSAIGVTDAGATPTNKLTLSGALSGGGTLTKAGGGILALTGVNGLTGGTVISAGTLQVNAGSSLGTGSLTFAPTGTGTCEVDLNTGGVVTVGDLSTAFRGTAATTELIQIGSGTTLTVTQTGNTHFGNGSSANQYGQIAGFGGLALSAASTGMLTLDGTTSYVGGTTVSGGTLNVLSVLGTGTLDSPSSAGQVTVNAGGTLSGTGQILSSSTAGAVFLNGGTISPGNAGAGVGTLSLTSLVLGTGSVMDFQLGTTSDQVQVSKFFFKSADATGQFQIGFSDAGGLAVGSTYDLVTFATGQTPGAGQSAVSASDFHAFGRDNLSDIQGTFTLDAVTGRLRFTPTAFSPTPATPAAFSTLLGAGMLALLRFGRQRRRGRR